MKKNVLLNFLYLMIHLVSKEIQFELLKNFNKRIFIFDASDSIDFLTLNNDNILQEDLTLKNDNQEKMRFEIKNGSIFIMDSVNISFINFFFVSMASSDKYVFSLINSGFFNISVIFLTFSSININKKCVFL